MERVVQGDLVVLALAPVDEIAECGGAAGDGLLVSAAAASFRLVVLNLGAAGFVAGHRAQAEAHLLLFDVDLDDLEVVLLTGFELRGLAGHFAGFRDVAEAFNALGDFNESAELGGAKYLAVDLIADAVSGEEALPYIGLKLLDAQAQAAVLRFDTENDCLGLFALLDDFRRMLDALGPAQV